VRAFVFTHALNGQNIYNPIYKTSGLREEEEEEAFAPRFILDSI